MGAGLAILVLLVLQAASSSGVFGTRTETVTVTTTTSPPSIQLYEVTFNETGTHCGYTPGMSYIDRWYATLGNTTIIEPSNAQLPFPNGAALSPLYQNMSTIVFSVPDGSYHYYVSFGPEKGTVDVKGSDVVVQVDSLYCP